MPILPISVFIIARDEADRISLTINSVKDWVDEVIVVDSGSKDDTVAVSESLGARAVFNEWSGYGPQKVFSEGLCCNDWLLNLDADEEISAELAVEIRALFEQVQPADVAYTLPILPFYPLQESGHRWTALHHPVRLYNRNYCGFKDLPVHDSVVVREGKTGRLKGMVIHRSFRSLTHHIDKANEVSSARAQDLVNKGRKPSGFSLLLIPLLAFLKSYLLRLQFLNGISGIVASHMYAFQRFTRLAKARELHHLNKRGK